MQIFNRAKIQKISDERTHCLVSHGHRWRWDVKLTTPASRIYSYMHLFQVFAKTKH